jgi:hypothetical protein
LGATSQSLADHANPGRNTIFQVERLWIAATLFGLAEQMHSRIHHVIGGPMRALAEVALATVQGALEPAVLAEAFAAGQQMTLAEAFATILAPTKSAGALTRA